jgi:hypothetical protein
LTSAEIAATATAATVATTATAVATTTAATVTTAVAAVFATEAATVTTVFAAVLFATGGRHEDGLGRDAEQGRELALQRRPEADRLLDGDDDGFDLDARALFATRTVFTTRAVAFGARFAAGTSGAFRARLARFAARTIAGDARLAAFFGDAFRTLFATRTVFATGTILAAFARRLALGRLLGEFAREVLGDFGWVRDHADGGTGGVALAARGDVLRHASTAELLRGDDGARLGGGFAGSADHGKGRKLRVRGFQLGFGDARRRSGGGRVLFRRGGGGVGGRVVLPGGFLAHGFSWCGDRMFGRLVKAVSAVVAEGPGLREVPVASV